MSLKESAGILLYRKKASGYEVLLVHPGGPFHAKKDDGSWSVPKGMVEAGEERLTAAKREFKEELGIQSPATGYIELHPIKQKSGKRVFVWAVEGDFDPTLLKSNLCRIEYPYKSGKWMEIPEIDKAAWFDIETAKQKILSAQIALLVELDEVLNDVGKRSHVV